MKQTAVQYLIEKVISDFGNEVNKIEIQTALLMEKNQIIDAYEEQNVKWDEFIDDDGRLILTNKYRNPEEYYNETYGQLK